MPEKIATKISRDDAGHILRGARRITELARELGCNRVTVSSVLQGRTSSKRILRAAKLKALQVMAELEAELAAGDEI